MKRLVFILELLLVMAILYPSSGLMAQDPDDPGEYDTLYFSPGGMRSMTGDTLYVWPGVFPQDVIIYINFWNDNHIAAVVVPLIDACNGPPCNADLDELKNNTENPLPKCFEGSRVVDFEILVGKFWYYPPNFYTNGAAMYSDPVPPGDGLLATLTFTVFDTGRICLDSCFWPPSFTLTFVDTQAHGYAPVLEKKTFVVANCGYNCGDPNNDGITTIADAVCMVNYVLRSGTPLCYEKSGDVNCDEVVDIVDITYIVNYLFKHGPAPEYCP